MVEERKNEKKRFFGHGRGFAPRNKTQNAPARFAPQDAGVKNDRNFSASAPRNESRYAPRTERRQAPRTEQPRFQRNERPYANGGRPQAQGADRFGAPVNRSQDNRTHAPRTERQFSSRPDRPSRQKPNRFNVVKPERPQTPRTERPFAPNNRPPMAGMESAVELNEQLFGEITEHPPIQNHDSREMPEASRPYEPRAARPQHSAKRGFRPFHASRSDSRNILPNDFQKNKPQRTENGVARDNQPVIVRKNGVRPNAHSREEGKSDAPALRIIPLGGMEEVGRNMTIFEYGEDIIILDMGLQFPEEDMPGIDYIIPNVDYLRGKERNVKAVIFSHAHMDHIGAAPILLERLGYPLVVGRPLTLAFLKHRQEDYKPGSADNMQTLEVKSLDDVLQFGAFKVSFFKVEHSIMDAMGLAIETPTATAVHLGDWTLEKNEHGQPTLDFTPLSKLKRPIVLMSESLGVIDIRPSASSAAMKKNLTQILTDAPGRVIIGTFASQIERINWIIEVAEKMGKKIAVDGYSMRNNLEIAKELGYIKASKGTIIKIDEIHDYQDKEIVILVTGAQGESNAVFYRVVNGDHRSLKIRPSDTVVFSSSIIPGNERSIQKLKDSIYRQTSNVIHGEIMNIHVSGHANREDNVRILKQIRPDYYLPVYAYHYMLVEASKLAKTLGYTDKNIFVLNNGQVAEFSRTGGQLLDEHVPVDYVMVDGLGVSDSNDVVLRDRKQLSEDGMFVVIVTIDTKTGELIGNPDIISRGFVYLKESKDLIEKTRARVKHLLKDSDPRSAAFEDYIKNKIRNDIGKFLFTKTEKRPMILPVLIEV
jgi:ribonuclease J